jgi:phage-related protein
MGALSSIGILDNGKLTDSAKTSFRIATAGSVESGFSIGASSISADLISLGNFKDLDQQEHNNQYPAWNAYYSSGLLQNIALSLDKIPDAGVLKPIGLFDPTKPIVVLITKLQSLFNRIFSFLDFPFIDLLILNIDVVLSKVRQILRALDDIISNLVEDGLSAAKDAAESFIDILKTIVREVLTRSNVSSSRISDVIESINDNIDDIKESVVETAQEITASSLLSIPSLPVPSLDISFIPPGIDVTPLFATVEADGIDGIGTKFVKLMAAFLALPAKIAEQIKQGVQAAIRIKEAFEILIINVAQGVQALLSALLELVWSIITSVISIAEAAILEIASIFQTVTFFVKYFIVSMISFLLGSGLIALSAAKILGIA